MRRTRGLTAIFSGTVGAGLLLLSGCGTSAASLTVAESITIAMTGSFESPPDATGDNEPRYEKFSLIGATLTEADGTNIEAYTDTAKDVRIINRPQIVVQKDLSKYVGKTFKSIALQFGTTVAAGGKYQDPIVIPLANPTPAYTGDFVVSTSSAIRLDISVQWKNTLTRDDKKKTESVTSPAFSFALTGN